MINKNSLIARSNATISDPLIALAASAKNVEHTEYSYFVKAITLNASEEQQCNIYNMIIRCIRSLADQPELEGENGYVIEECCKICDIMGWSPRITEGE